MRASDIIVEYIADSRGPGGTPKNIDIDYFGVRVQMRPSTFLKLAYPLKEQRSVEYFKSLLVQGKGFAPPTLDIYVADDFRNDPSIPHEGRIHGHEGRNRATAILEVEGDAPIEVHIIFHADHYEWRNRHITDAHMMSINKGVKSESGTFVVGPLFK